MFEALEIRDSFSTVSEGDEGEGRLEISSWRFFKLVQNIFVSMIRVRELLRKTWTMKYYPGCRFPHFCVSCFYVLEWGLLSLSSGNVLFAIFHEQMFSLSKWIFSTFKARVSFNTPLWYLYYPSQWLTYHKYLTVINDVLFFFLNQDG